MHVITCVGCHVCQVSSWGDYISAHVMTCVSGVIVGRLRISACHDVCHVSRVSGVIVGRLHLSACRDVCVRCHRGAATYQCVS